MSGASRHSEGIKLWRDSWPIRPLVEHLEARLAPATFVVDRLTDDVTDGNARSGVGSLRFCLNRANLTAGSDVIQFSTSGTIVLGSELQITDSVQIISPTSGVKIQRNTAAGPFRLFNVASTQAMVTLFQLELTGGDVSTGYSPGYASSGGAIASQGGLTLQDCYIHDNAAVIGGGVYVENASFLVMDRCRINANQGVSQGAGLGVVATPLWITDSLIQGNVIPGNNTAGGGLYVQDSPVINLTSTTFQNNTAGYGGGLLVQSNGADAYATLTNCTLANNFASVNGGAIGTTAAAGFVSVVLGNSTIANNTSSGPAGGAYAYSATGGYTSIRYQSSLFANNSNNNLWAYTGYGPYQLLSDGNNLSTDLTGNLTGPGDLPGALAYLAPLGYYGGLTPTMPLLPGPAVDGGSLESTATDQRGVSRPQGAAPDIGAVESALVVTLSGNGQTAEPNAPFANPLTVTLVENGVAVVGVAVTFRVTSGSATLSSSTVVTDGTGTASVTLVAGSAAGPVTVTAQVGTATYNFSTQVIAVNPAPTGLVLTPSAAKIFVGQTFTLDGSFSDLPGDEAHSIYIDWGDGQSETVSLASGTTFRVTHVYTSIPSSEGGESSGPDGFAFLFVEVRDSLGQSDYDFASVEVQYAPITLVIDTSDEFVNASETFERNGKVSGGDGTYSILVSYAGGRFERLDTDANGSFKLSHLYTTEGTYDVILAVDDGESGASYHFQVDVLLDGVPKDLADKTVVPGGEGNQATVTTTDASVTLVRGFGSVLPASIIVAVVPTGVAANLNGSFTLDSKSITTAFDVRAINTGLLDVAYVTFRYKNDDFDQPTLRYYNSDTKTEDVVDSRLYVVDRFSRTITLLLDANSTPSLRDLRGTVFTIAVPLAVPAPSSVDPNLVSILTKIGTPGSGVGSNDETLLGGLVQVATAFTGRGAAVVAATTVISNGLGEEGSGGGANSVARSIAELPNVPDTLITLPAPILTPGSAELPLGPEGNDGMRGDPPMAVPASGPVGKETNNQTSKLTQLNSEVASVASGLQWSWTGPDEVLDVQDEVFLNLGDAGELSLVQAPPASEAATWQDLGLAALAALAVRAGSQTRLDRGGVSSRLRPRGQSVRS